MAKVDVVLKDAEEVLAEENATEQPGEITKEDLQKRTDRILDKMDKEEVTDKKLRKAATKVKEESLPTTIYHSTLRKKPTLLGRPLTSN